MSHFSVAVIHRKDQDIEELLAPYDENIEVKPYVIMTRQEAIAHARKYHGLGKSATDEDCWKSTAEGYHNKTDKDGNIYSTYNPNSKWDWWEIGGRFHGLLLVNGKPANTGIIRDIDFSPRLKRYKYARKVWETVIEGKRKCESIFLPCTQKELLEAYPDKESFARNKSLFSTFAVVAPDGKWYEVGQMGWWGLSSETVAEERDWNEHYKERFIDPANPEMYITIVDCHI